ncbi:MAG: hypothetical protein EU541_04680 [Promethearchaeota archaeon]|nr:MAG: hypothetical protein EU541_04680 [Candidatus Lokiarchaeota archaeon]
MTKKILDDEKFIRNVEDLIDPKEVSFLYFYSTFKRLLPRSLFKKLLNKTSKKTPYMGFVIEPYSLFLFFKLKNIKKAKSLLPERYELIKTQIFADEEPEYYLGMGIFNTRASTFWGSRLESYLITKDKETGHKSWIFIDILSNTIIAIPSLGVADRNSKNAIYTTSSKGDIIVDFKEDATERQIIVNGNITNAKMRSLDQPLWVLGNTSIAHKKEFSDNDDDPFAVIFDPAEVDKALDVPIEDMHIKVNTLFPDLAEPELIKVLCFPFAQHYIADSPGRRTYIKDVNDMIENYNKIAEMKEMETFSTNNIKVMLLMGISLFMVIFVSLIILLIINL